MAATNVRFPDNLKSEAQGYAESIGISFNALLSVALREYLDRRQLGTALSLPALPPEPRQPPPASIAPPLPERALEPLEPAASPEPQRHVSQFFPGSRSGQCRCGSRLKWKQCHGRADGSPPPEPEKRPPTLRSRSR